MCDSRQLVRVAPESLLKAIQWFLLGSYSLRDLFFSRGLTFDMRAVKGILKTRKNEYFVNFEQSGLSKEISIRNLPRELSDFPVMHFDSEWKFIRHRLSQIRVFSLQSITVVQLLIIISLYFFYEIFGAGMAGEIISRTPNFSLKCGADGCVDSVKFILGIFSSSILLTVAPIPSYFFLKQKIKSSVTIRSLQVELVLQLGVAIFLFYKTLTMFLPILKRLYPFVLL